MASKKDNEVLSLCDWVDAGIMRGNKKNVKLRKFEMKDISYFVGGMEYLELSRRRD